ncbi:hypothetical protein K788_0007270 [Paraburkholderia caribensis MBA4]|uniref:Uncharacterized protein n=1 Tax=Paraburkholderia caribensis MBA4 TaxID=1323664 RepID=A0A0P0RKI3_9BURK|nr:hypothetical protein K788_0007270 [Paraburkholderia caribensis MBA4]
MECYRSADHTCSDHHHIICIHDSASLLVSYRERSVQSSIRNLANINGGDV